MFEVEMLNYLTRRRYLDDFVFQKKKTLTVNNVATAVNGRHVSRTIDFLFVESVLLPKLPAEKYTILVPLMVFAIPGIVHVDRELSESKIPLNCYCFSNLASSQAPCGQSLTLVECCHRVIDSLES